MPKAIGQHTSDVLPKSHPAAWERRVRRLIEERDASAVDALPFVTPVMGGPACLWSPRPTGDYLFDCALGRRYAAALLPLLRELHGGGLLAGVVLAMMEHGDAERDRGLAIGMMGAIGAAAGRGVR